MAGFRSFSFFALSVLLLLSCRKDQLLPTDSVSLKIDTLTYVDHGLGDAFLVDGEFNTEPIITDQHVYSVVSVNEGSAIGSSYYLMKFEIATGEILWQWNDYVSPDWGYPQRLVFSDGKILLGSNNNIYILNATTGQTDFMYTAPTGMYLHSASLHEDLIYVSLSNNEGAMLAQLKTDGSQLQTLYEIDSSRTIAGAVEVLSLFNYDLLVWEVIFRDAQTSSTQLLYKNITDQGSFGKHVMGTGKKGSSLKKATIVKDGETDQVFIHANNGMTQCLNFGDHVPLQWLNIHEGHLLKQNTAFLYTFSRNRFAMYDKNTGDQLFNTENFYKSFCVSDDFVLIDGGWAGFRVYDANTMELIGTKGGASVSAMHHLGENVFFFSNQHSNGHSYFGTLRITTNG